MVCFMWWYLKTFSHLNFVVAFRCSWSLFPRGLSLTWPLRCSSLPHMSTKTINVNTALSIKTNTAAPLSATTATTDHLWAIWRLAAETTDSLWRRFNWGLLYHRGQRGATVNHTPPSVHLATRFQMRCHPLIMVKCQLHSLAVLGLLIASPLHLLRTPPAEGREVSAGLLTTFCPGLWTTWSGPVPSCSPGQASCSAAAL